MIICPMLDSNMLSKEFQMHGHIPPGATDLLLLRHDRVHGSGGVGWREDGPRHERGLVECGRLAVRAVHRS